MSTKYDVIIVMSGGLEINGSVKPWVKKRLDLALTMYHKNPTYILCTSAGTSHKPPVLDKNKFVIHEATAAADYLIKNKVDTQYLLREQMSYDTLGCVYFCLLLCVIPRNWINICVITSDFHLERTRELFLWIFNLHQQDKYNLTFLKTDDKDNVPPDILAARRKREKQSLINLKNNVITKIKTMKELNEWIFTEHKAYSCAYLKHKEYISNDIKKSY